MNARSITSHFAGLLFTGASMIAYAAGSLDFFIVEQATTTDRLIRITEEPHEMADSTAGLCLVPIGRPHKLHEGFSTPAYCHVYASRDAEYLVRTGGSDYPVGALIVKTKFPKNHPKRIEIYTVMRKMHSGYDVENGDWEYSVIDGRTRRLQSRGRIDSCIECHAAYSKTDYVTRAYIAENG
ncbi:MAG: cytochrome P460 family protein [Planctomycetota bacterium]